MSLRESVRSASLVQFPGAGLAYLAVIILGVRFGSDGLGTFSLVQTKQQFLATVALLGLPQALVYFVSIGSISRKRQQILTYSVTVFGLLLGVAVGMRDLGSPSLLGPTFGVAVALVVLATMQRSTVLGTGRTRAYSWLTALPQATLFLLVLTTIALTTPGSPLDLWLSITIVTIPYVVASCSGWAVQRLSGAKTTVQAVTRDSALVSSSALLRYALPAALVGIAATGARAGWLSYVNDSSGLSATGLVSAALLISQTVTYPIVLLSPILVHHWADRADSRIRRAVLITVLSLVAVLILAGGLVTLSATKLGLWDWSVFLPLITAAWLVALIVSADVADGMAGTLGLASGDSWIQAVCEFSRVSVLALAVVVGHVSSLEFQLGAWAAGAWACAILAWLLVLVRGRSATKRQPQSVSDYDQKESGNCSA